MGTIGTPWLAFIAAATYRWERSNRGTLPRPAIYAGSAVVFSLLALLGESASGKQLAQILGWSLVVSQVIGGSFLTPQPGQSVASSAMNRPWGPGPANKGGAPGANVNQKAKAGKP